MVYETDKELTVILVRNAEDLSCQILFDHRHLEKFTVITPLKVALEGPQTVGLQVVLSISISHYCHTILGIVSDYNRYYVEARVNLLPLSQV